MGKRILLGLTAAGWAIGAATVVHCVGGDDSSTTDGGMDATTDAVQNDVQAPDAGFTLTLVPTHLTEDIGDSFQVTVNINRAPLFTAPVDFAVSAPPNLTATTPNPAQTSSTFFVTANSGAGDYTVTVTGTSGSLLQNATLGVRVGSILHPDGGVFVVPAYASSLTVKAWGAAGGGGPDCTYLSTLNGGAGGGGGFASGTLAVNPGDMYLVAVGGGGSGALSVGSGGGGGGGGYSAFLAPDGGVILLAAGGGGGVAAFCPGSSANVGYSGGPGGGTAGGNGGNGLYYGSGGQPDAGGTVGGSALMGGAGGGGGAIVGGVPGGGNGGTPQGGGGGGGGYFGGGGGGAGQGILNGGGGGGGSGWNTVDGGMLVQASGSTAASSTDPDYGDAGPGMGSKGNGNPGLVVIRLPKP